MDENKYDYDRETIACLAGFESLWQRVTEKTSPSVFSEEKALQRFICQELCTAQNYAVLARMFQSHSRTLLAAHCTDAKRRARRLQAEYFIRTGLRCERPQNCEYPAERLASLRNLLQSEQELSDGYRRAALNTQCPILKELYTRFSAETAERAKAIRALLLNCF